MFMCVCVLPIIATGLAYVRKQCSCHILYTGEDSHLQHMLSSSCFHIHTLRQVEPETNTGRFLLPAPKKRV